MSKHVGTVAPDNGLGIGLREEMRRKLKDPERLNRSDPDVAAKKAEANTEKLGILEKVPDKPSVRQNGVAPKQHEAPKPAAGKSGDSSRAEAQNAAESAFLDVAAYSKSLGELSGGNKTNGSEQPNAKPKVFAEAHAASSDNAKTTAAPKQADLRQFAAMQMNGFSGVINGRKSPVEEPSKKQAPDNQTRKNTKEGEQKQASSEAAGKKSAAETPDKGEPQKLAMGMAGMAGVGQSANVKEKTQLPEKSADNIKEEDSKEPEEGRRASSHTAASIANNARKHLESGAGGMGSGTTSDGNSGLAFEISANKISIEKISDGEVDTAKACGVDFINRVDGDAATDAKIASLQLENTIKSIKDGGAKATIDALIANHTEAALTDRVVSAVMEEAKSLIEAFRERGRRGVYGGLQA